jgi:class 3 adenylate cyclase
VCRVAAGVVGTLEEVGTDIHCQACNIGYGVDFADHVEAVFQSNPAIRAVDARVYCASSPSFLPHVWGQLELDAKETREESAELPAGRMHVRTLGGNDRVVDFDVPGAGSLVEITIHVDQLEAEVKPATGSGGLLRVVNRTGRSTTILLERASWAADAVLGSVVASFPDFLEMFATEAPAAGVDLSISHLALLFSDLTGSTALYQRVGDARAFAIVEEHFRIMDRIVRHRNGAIVKTMGDAVMASFASVQDAVQAALDMVAENDEVHSVLDLGVKIGVHAGPCLAVRANDRLDFFGTTVNMAARLQGQAQAGHLVLTAETAADLADVLSGIPARRFRAALKGIAAEQDLIALDAREARAARSKAAS